MVVARGRPPPAAATEALLGGEWRGARVGVTTGSGGSEALVRFWWLAGAVRSGSARRIGGAWLPGYGRLPRARPLAGGAAVDRVQHRRGAGGGPQGRARLGLRSARPRRRRRPSCWARGRCWRTSRTARRRRRRAPPCRWCWPRGATGYRRGDPLLGAIVGACARAGAALCGRTAGPWPLRALPERDPLALRRALGPGRPAGASCPATPLHARTGGWRRRRWGATWSWPRGGGGLLLDADGPRGRVARQPAAGVAGGRPRHSRPAGGWGRRRGPTPPQAMAPISRAAWPNPARTAAGSTASAPLRH